MIVYTGRKGLHIFDIDRENWVFNCNRTDYKYQDIYYQARGIDNTSDEEGPQDDEDLNVNLEDLDFLDSDDGDEDYEDVDDDQEE